MGREVNVNVKGPGQKIYIVSVLGTRKVPVTVEEMSGEVSEMRHLPTISTAGSREEARQEARAVAAEHLRPEDGWELGANATGIILQPRVEGQDETNINVVFDIKYAGD